MASTASELQQILQQELDILIERLREADPAFIDKAKAAQRAYAKLFSARDRPTREAHTHKFAAEYSNVHPQNEPNQF